MWYLIYIHFSVLANFVTVVHLDVFCLTQFYFDKYLSFILNFVPHYCDCLCDTFLKAIWKSVHWHFNISINNKVLFFSYKNFIEKIKHLHMTITTLMLNYLAPVLLISPYYIFFIHPEASIFVWIFRAPTHYWHFKKIVLVKILGNFPVKHSFWSPLLK